MRLERFRRNPWLLAYVVVITVSLADWTMTLSVLCQEVGTVPCAHPCHGAVDSLPTFPHNTSLCSPQGKPVLGGSPEFDPPLGPRPPFSPPNLQSLHPMWFHAPT